MQEVLVPVRESNSNILWAQLIPDQEQVPVYEFTDWIARQKISRGKILISLIRRCFHILPCRILKQILWLDEEFYAKLQTIRRCTGNLSTNPVSRIQPENFAFWPTELKSKIVKLNNPEPFADLANKNKTWRVNKGSKKVRSYEFKKITVDFEPGKSKQNTNRL